MIRNSKYYLLSFVVFLYFNIHSFAQQGIKTPIMGWSSWNEFHIDIDEGLIKEQANAMVSSGMKDAGYSFINIDDGYFGGRDAKGNLLSHPEKFPHGMKYLADYIHAKGLSAGIYSDAGKNTCGSHWDKDPFGIGVGLYGYEKQDLELMLNTWEYDFIKVDWCGGEWIHLNEKEAYTNIANWIQEIKPNTIYNICMWEFPGEWAIKIASSWRISGDITNKFKSILHIIDLNIDLGKYASPGHVNDMDMLQVGRGMTYEEDKAHFSMWCMLNSPLLAGNDLRNMTQETISILTNKEVIALNQDSLVYQARKIGNYSDWQIWAKPLQSFQSGEMAVALLNRSNKKQSVRLRLKDIGMDSQKGYVLRDLWEKMDYPVSQKKEVSFELKPHSIVVLKVKGSFLESNFFN